MRLLFLQAVVLLLMACSSAWGSETTAPIYVRANNVKAAVVLRFSADLLGKKVFIDPKLGEQQINVQGEYRSEEVFFAHFASLLSTVVKRDAEAIQIGENPAEPQVALPVPRENNCPYRYPDLQAAVKAMLPHRLRICQPLEFFPLDSLRVGAILGQGGRFQAIVVSPDGVAWRLKEGDYLGQDFGRIFRISSSEIDLREIVQDENDEWNERRSALPVK
ncbi:pilus assembly protein PilP [Ideonella paludis]|uniref:Pilus assembly protein PilP n=1 Tax=Ideonella paludis TaxID=1233411 RepID=A0ABS5E1S8_9BURK|nr:pilus assembly protein PilP [Ideonella paludis]MBQ0937338.1 pilus assembly protein PilP [Ideonella paludis]